MLKRYSDERQAVAPSRSSALLGVVVCDGEGVPQTNRIGGLEFRLGASSGAPRQPRSARQVASRREAKLQAALAERLRRSAPDGQPLPLDHPALLAVHSVLVRELRLKPEWVRPPSFAICAYEYLFVHEPPEPLILNSFFLADLARRSQLVASGQAPLALKRYLGSAVEARHWVTRRCFRRASLRAHAERAMAEPLGVALSSRSSNAPSTPPLGSPPGHHRGRRAAAGTATDAPARHRRSSSRAEVMIR